MLDMNHYYEAKEAIDPILKSATIQSASKRASQIYTIMAACDYSIKEDFARAFAHFDKALELARNLNDKPSEATAAYWYGMGLSLNCEFEKVYHLQKTLSFNSAINHLPRMSALKGLLGYVGYFYQGKIHKAYEASGVTELAVLPVEIRVNDHLPKGR